MHDRQECDDSKLDYHGQRLLRAPGKRSFRHESNHFPPLENRRRDLYRACDPSTKTAGLGPGVRITNETGIENTDETPDGMIRDGDRGYTERNDFTGTVGLPRPCSPLSPNCGEKALLGKYAIYVMLFLGKSFLEISVKVCKLLDKNKSNRLT